MLCRIFFILGLLVEDHSILPFASNLSNSTGLDLQCRPSGGLIPLHACPVGEVGLNSLGACNGIVL